MLDTVVPDHDGSNLFPTFSSAHVSQSRVAEKRDPIVILDALGHRQFEVDVCARPIGAGCRSNGLDPVPTLAVGAQHPTKVSTRIA